MLNVIERADPIRCTSCATTVISYQWSNFELITLVEEWPWPMTATHVALAHFIDIIYQWAVSGFFGSVDLLVTKMCSSALVCDRLRTGYGHCTYHANGSTCAVWHRNGHRSGYRKKVMVVGVLTEKKTARASKKLSKLRWIMTGKCARVELISVGVGNVLCDSGGAIPLC